MLKNLSKEEKRIVAKAFHFEKTHLFNLDNERNPYFESLVMTIEEGFEILGIINEAMETLGTLHF